MESEDLRLIEISGEEDDSLLIPLPDMDTSTDDFTLISPFRGLNGRVDPVKPSSSSRRGFNNKENINTDRAEMPKLSVEPLHMKRKKKSGGYSLQKSLAWDRTFSTEEGILDKLELSLLSGTLANTCRETLFTINEEKRIPTSNDSQHDANSAFLNSKKKSTFKEIPVVALKQDTRKASSKVRASHNGRTISKSGGCSRPSSLPSLKRPANMNHVKAATKDSKLPKFQMSKPSACSLPTSSKSTIPRASHLKHQVTGSAAGIQKNAGLRSSSKKVRKSQEKAKAAEPLKDKSSLCMLGENDEKSTSKFIVSTESSPPVNKASTVVEMNPDATVPSSLAHSSESDGGCTPFALRFPHNTHTTNSSMKYLPVQAMQPSGLRMPSPSVGFFRQTKASDTLRLLKAESNMCQLQRSGDLMPPEALTNQEGKGKLANLNCRILQLESKSSTESCKIIKKGSEGNNVEEVNVPSVIKKIIPVGDKLRNRYNIDVKLPDQIEHEVQKLQDAELLMNGKQYPPQTGKHESINKDGDHMNFIPDFIENKGSAGSDFRDAQLPQASQNAQSLVPCGLDGAIGNPNDDSICNSQYESISFGEEVTKEVYVGGCNNLPSGECEMVKSLAVEDDVIFDNDKHVMRIKSNSSEALRELRNNGGGNCESMNPAGSDLSEEKIRSSEVASQHEDSHCLKEAPTSKQITDREQIGGLIVEVSSVCDEDEPNPGGISIYSEHMSQGGNVLYTSDQSLGKIVCMDQCQDQQVEAGLSALPFQQDGSGFDKCDVTSAQAEVQTDKITVVGEDPADIICFNVVEIAPAENCNHSTNEEFNHDKILANSTTCLEYSLSNILCPQGDGNKLIKDCLFKGMDEYEIPDSPNKPNDGNQAIMVKHGMLSPESLEVEESQICSHVDFFPSSPTERGHHKVLLERLHTAPQLGDTTEASEVVGKRANALRNILQREDKHLESYDNDAQKLVPGKGPSAVVEECESSNAFENFQDAVQAPRHVDECGLESPSFLNQVSRPFNGSGNEADELDIIHCVEDCLSSPAAIESLSLELDPSQGTSENHIAGVTTDRIELVERDQTSSSIKTKAGDILNQDVVVEDSETGKPSESERFHDELCHGLEDIEQRKNDNTNFPVENIKSCPKKGNHLMLPRNVIPFSDEWLAAMEAAGEDILTMKGGAVQNSPQEKSLPEPSPWSPVKKKNNQPGPFDCTKFHHAS